MPEFRFGVFPKDPCIKSVVSRLVLSECGGTQKEVFRLLRVQTPKEYDGTLAPSSSLLHLDHKVNSFVLPHTLDMVCGLTTG